MPLRHEACEASRANRAWTPIATLPHSRQIVGWLIGFCARAGQVAKMKNTATNKPIPFNEARITLVVMGESHFWQCFIDKTNSRGPGDLGVKKPRLGEPHAPLGFRLEHTRMPPRPYWSRSALTTHFGRLNCATTKAIASGYSLESTPKGAALKLAFPVMVPWRQRPAHRVRPSPCRPFRIRVSPGPSRPASAAPSDPSSSDGSRPARV